MKPTCDVATLIEPYFTERLMRQRNITANTIASYRTCSGSFDEPAHSALIQRVLAIPTKRHDKREVKFLTRPEIEAILALPIA